MVGRRTEEVGVVLRVELAGRSTIYRVQFASGSRYLGEEQLEWSTPTGTTLTQGWPTPGSS